MSEQIKIIAVNQSEKTGTVKAPVAVGRLGPRGLAGDAHAGSWHRQVSMLGQDSVDKFSRQAGRRIAPGEFAENLTVGEMSLAGVAVLDRFRGPEVELEVTQIGKKCHGDSCAIFREVGSCIMPKEGLFIRVIKGGEIRSGDCLAYRPRPLRFQVITLSDRAFAGEYEDRSGPRIAAALTGFFAPRRWHQEIENILLPDDPARLEARLTAARREKVDVVITTGGTGVGPRDHTPEVVRACCDKLIPGIMEAIRHKYGVEFPNAWLSRGVAGVAGTTLIYALPGSVKAVGEYMEEILKTLEHLVLMLHGLGHH